MALHELSLDSLLALDGGRVAVAWQQALLRAVADCEDRPAEEKPRVINLQAEIVPVTDENDVHIVDSVSIKFQIKETIPTRKSKLYSFGIRKKRDQLQLVFNDLSDDDINQRTIDQQED